MVEEFLVNDAEYSIPEASTKNDRRDEKPDDGWAAPRFWFSPYSITIARAPDRGYPPWVHARLTGSTTDPDGGFDKPAALLGYTNRADAWQAYTDDYRGDAEYRVLAEVLTPQGAALLAAAAQRLATVGYQEVVAYGDEPLNRKPDDDGWYTDEVFLANLPPVCDGCDQAWRLAMVRGGRPGRGSAGRAGAAAPVLPRNVGMLPCPVLQARP